MRFPPALAILTLLAGLSAAGTADAQAPWKKAPMPNSPDELFLQGAVLVETGALDAAEKLARGAIKDHPRAHGFHLLLGDVHIRRQRPAEAYYEWYWEYLRSGPSSEPGAIAISRIKSVIESERGPEADEVRRVLDAIMLTPKDAKTALASLRSIERDRGSRFALKATIAEALHAMNSDEAITAYRELLRLDESFVPGYVQLAALLEQRGRKQEALDLMAKARMIDPTHWRLPKSAQTTP